MPNFIPIRPAVWISIQNKQTHRHTDIALYVLEDRRSPTLRFLSCKKNFLFSFGQSQSQQFSAATTNLAPPSLRLDENSKIIHFLFLESLPWPHLASRRLA